MERPSLENLETPAALVDMARVEANLRVVPNHVCASVNLHERLWAVRGDAVEGVWAVLGRGWGAP